MNGGMRHSVQRARRAALKSDAVILLDRLAALADMPETLRLEVAEMRMRLAPPPGVKAPVVRTRYTQGKH